MALGCRRRSAARGDVTVPCLRSPCCRALRPAVPRRLIASHAEITAPRSSSPLVWRRSSKQGSDPRRSPLREVSWGWSHASDANENEAPPPGAGRWAKRSTAHQRGRHRSGRARENAAPCSASDRNVARQHARAATSPQPSRRAAHRHAPAPDQPAGSRRAGLPTARTPVPRRASSPSQR